MSRAEEKLAFMEERVMGPAKRKVQVEERLKELADTCEKSSCFRGLDIPLDLDSRSSFLHFVTGSLPTENLENLEERIDEKTLLFPLDQQKGRQTLVAVTTSRGRPDLERALEEAGFRREVLPEAEGATVDTLYEEAEKEQRKLAAELQELEDGLEKTAAEFQQPLREVEGLVDVECRLIEAGQKFPRTEAAVLIAGWVPADAESVIDQRLEEVTGGRLVLRTAFPDRGKRG